MKSKLLLLSFLLFQIHSPSIQAMRDPFEPVDIKQFKTKLLTLEQQAPVTLPENENFEYRVKLIGIIWDPEKPLAILGVQDQRKIVHPGTRFHNKEVLAITKDYVLLKSGTKTFILKVGQFLII